MDYYTLFILEDIGKGIWFVFFLLVFLVYIWMFFSRNGSQLLFAVSFFCLALSPLNGRIDSCRKDPPVFSTGGSIRAYVVVLTSAFSSCCGTSDEEEQRECNELYHATYYIDLYNLDNNYVDIDSITFHEICDCNKLVLSLLK